MIQRFWNWAKQNPWKAAALPLLVVGILLSWFLQGGKKSLGTIIAGATDDQARDALKAQEAAMETYRQQLATQEKAARAKLNGASKEQLKELKEVQTKTPNEVAEWINKLS